MAVGQCTFVGRGAAARRVWQAQACRAAAFTRATLAAPAPLQVLDSGNTRVLKFGPAFEFLLMWGGYGTKPGQFMFPEGITTDSLNNVYITDGGSYRIQMFDPTGRFIREWRSKGGNSDEIVGIACDSKDLLYVADRKNKRIQVCEGRRAGAGGLLGGCGWWAGTRVGGGAERRGALPGSLGRPGWQAAHGTRAG